jgi:serpin B
MKTLKWALSFSLVFPFLCSGAADSLNQPDVVAGNTAFAFDLYTQLRSEEENQGKNLFLSPYSISTALAMTYGGARGNTASQMAKALHFDLPQEMLHPVFAEMEKGLNAVQQKGQVKLAVANSLWPQKDNKFLPAYLELCQKNYGVTITPLDFVEATEPARMTINTWVEDKTNKKIQELLKPGILTVLTRLVLVNAIYFKGNWASQFDKQLTETKPFHVSTNETVNASLMHMRHEFRYAETPDLQLLELQYAGNDLSMLVLLPRKVDGLAELEKSLNQTNYAAWTKVLRSREVQLALPKFKTTSEFSLKGTLSALGMTDAFRYGIADFSGMDGTKELFISAVVHKAFVDVNEEGTEAAAATAVVMTKSVPTFFRADHPFLFLIRDNHTGSILFLGRIEDPTK